MHLRFRVDGVNRIRTREGSICCCALIIISLLSFTAIPLVRTTQQNLLGSIPLVLYDLSESYGKFLTEVNPFPSTLLSSQRRRWLTTHCSANLLHSDFQMRSSSSV